ncbi:MAG: hypothetical protein ACTSX6_00320 [Candidatus Heimdallarchaeaceae archaeon]
MRTLGESLWCQFKHIELSREHILETLEKLYREGKNDKLVRELEKEFEELRKLRDEIAKKYGKKTQQEVTCYVCLEDFGNFYTHTESFKNHLIDKDLNKNANNGDKMEIKDVGLVVGGQVLGELYETYGVPAVDEMLGDKDKPVSEKKSTLIDLALGIGLPAAALYVKDIPEDAKLLMAVLGAHRLADGARKLLLQPKAVAKVESSPIVEMSYPSQSKATMQEAVVPIYEERYPFFFAR